MLQILLRIDGVDCGIVYQIDEATGTLKHVAQTGMAGELPASLPLQQDHAPSVEQFYREEVSLNLRPSDLPAPLQAALDEAGVRLAATIPIRHEGQRVAGLLLASRTRKAFSDEALASLADVGNYVGCAVARLRAETIWQESAAALEQRERFLNTLNRITRTALAASSAQDMLQQLSDELHKLFDADNCYFTLWDDAKRRVVPTVASGSWRQDYPKVEADRDEQTITAAALDLGRPLVIQDSHATPYLSARLARLFPRSALLALPFIAGGRKLGAALISFKVPHTFTEEEITRGEQVADQIALAIHKIRLLEKAHTRWQEAETLRQAALAVTTSLEQDKVIERILAQLQKVVDYDTASVQLLHDERLTIVGGYGFPNHDEIMGLSFDISADAAGENPNRDVIQNQRAMIVSDGPAAYEGFRQEPHAQANIRAWMGVPMKIGERLIGMIALDKSKPDFYTYRHAQLTEAFAAQAAVAMENAILFERAQQELAERQRIERALRESEEMYRAQIEQSHDGIALVYRGRFVLLNPRIQALFGVTPEITDQDDFEILDYVAPHDRERMRRVLEKAVEESVIDHPHMEFTGLDSQGNEIEIEMTRAFVSYGGETAMQVVVRDVTERKRMAERLRQQEHLAALGQLSGGIAHELRSILTTLILYAELDLMRPDLPARVVKHLHTIISESRKAADLTQQILDFSSNSMLQLCPVNLAALTQEVVARTRSVLPKQIRTEIEVQDNCPLIKADPERIEQALVNLITNARDAMPDGGLLRCTVARQRVEKDIPAASPELTPGEWVRVTISDTGTGLTDDVRAHLFEPFFTTKDVGQGRGLGLPQVYGIIRQHGGAIDVESELGKGTTFHLFFHAVDAIP